MEKTPEPSGGKPESDQLIFTIQKHDASRLHYDFRLEMEGVLKSWAIPKGPSLNPEDKRLAIMVEDHPYDYKDFEGVIPEKHYGAGPVIVWDQGTYKPMGEYKTKEEAEKQFLEGLKEGHITFFLEGKKVKGEFALIKSKKQQENQWLLIKAKDQYSSKEDILLKSSSVISHKTIEDIAKKKA